MPESILLYCLSTPLTATFVLTNTDDILSLPMVFPIMHYIKLVGLFTWAWQITVNACLKYRLYSGKLLSHRHHT